MLKTTKTRMQGQRAFPRLQEVLAEVPFVRALSLVESQRGSGVDFTVSLRVGQYSRKLLCKSASSGQPRIAREACLRMAEERRGSSRVYPVFIAPYVSPAAAAICERYDTGYADFAGNCRIAFDTVFIKREGFPNATAQKRNLRSLYSPKAERVLRVLLASGPRVWKTQALADAAEVSVGQVASVKKLLMDREWVISSYSGFTLGVEGSREAFQAAAAPLLAEWVQSYRASRNEVVEYYSLKPAPEVEAQLAKFAATSKCRVALTGLSAAARFAPTVRYQRVTAYAGDVEAVAASLALKRVSSGANVVLFQPYDEGVFHDVALKDGAPVVSAIQAYLDLTSIKARGEEAARAILEEVIQPQWR